MTCLPYAQLIDIKRWADRGLYDAISRNLDRLPSEDIAIMLRILDHIHVVDRIFQHHLQGLPHNFLAARSQEIPDFKMLAGSALEVDDWYASYVGSLAEDDFEQPVDFVFTSGKPARMRRGEIILHVCLHGTYQRQCRRGSSVARIDPEPRCDHGFPRRSGVKGVWIPGQFVMPGSADKFT